MSRAQRAGPTGCVGRLRLWLKPSHSHLRQPSAPLRPARAIEPNAPPRCPPRSGGLRWCEMSPTAWTRGGCEANQHAHISKSPPYPLDEIKKVAFGKLFPPFPCILVVYTRKTRSLFSVSVSLSVCPLFEFGVVRVVLLHCFFLKMTPLNRGFSWERGPQRDVLGKTSIKLAK